MLPFAQAVSEKLLVLVVLVVVLGAGFPAGAEQTVREMGIVVPRYLNVRVGPDRTSNSVKILPQGRVVRIIRHTGNGWLEIEDGDLTGFVRKRDRYIRLYKAKAKTKIRHDVSTIPPEKPKTDVELEIEEHTREIEEIDTRIKEKQKELKGYSKKEVVIINGLNEIDRSLSDARRKLSETKKDLDLLDAEIRINTNALDDLTRVIATNETYIAKRLSALYKLRKIGQMNVLASADSVYDFLNRRRAIEQVLKADDRVMNDHLRNLNRLTDLKIRLSEQKSINVGLEEDYTRQIGVIERSKEKKKTLLEDIKRKKSLGLAAIRSLKEAAEELDQTLRALDQGFDRSGTAAQSDGRLFIEKKGLLKMPVNGKIVSFFGKSTDRQFNVETFHSGIKVIADRGDPIQAVSGGRVLFSDWLQGYGNLIIIDHGDNYYTLYGHAEEVFKEKGDPVEEREVIATVGDTGSLTGPALHFEVRHRGEALDPLSWLE